MKHSLLLLLSLTFYLSCSAQAAVDSSITKKRNQLYQIGIDTVVCYYRYCNGRLPNPVFLGDTTCQAYDHIKYLIWTRGTQSFLQRFDECRSHPPVIIPSLFVNLVRKNFYQLKKEKLFPPEYTVGLQGMKLRTSMSIDHTCHTVFNIYTSTAIINKNIDEYYLANKYVDGKHRNIHYLHNQRSLQSRLKQQIENVLSSSTLNI